MLKSFIFEYPADFKNDSFNIAAQKEDLANINKIKQ